MDEIFLHKKIEYLEEFADEYQKRVNLPFIISTTATSLTSEKVNILKKMNCVNVGLGVETGNEELRRRVLNKKIPNKHYESAYKLLNEAGIRATAQLMFGVPHETENDYKTTLRMIKKWNLDTAHVAVFYPFKGSALREYALKEGFLDKKKIEDFEENKFISTRNTATMLNFGEEQIEKMEHYRKLFVVYKEIPEWLWPLVDECGKKGDVFSEKLEVLLRELVAKKRFS